MITSYVTPDQTALYISLVGSLNSFTARDIVHEFHDRYVPAVSQCFVDFSTCEVAEDDGLDVLEDLSSAAQEKGIEFSILAGGNPSLSRITGAADRYHVPVVDSGRIPFLRNLF